MYKEPTDKEPVCLCGVYLVCVCVCVVVILPDYFLQFNFSTSVS